MYCSSAIPLIFNCGYETLKGNSTDCTHQSLFTYNTSAYLGNKIIKPFVPLFQSVIAESNNITGLQCEYVYIGFIVFLII